MFALSWPAVIGNIERRNWSRAFIAFLALLLTGSYSVTAALGSAAGGRANATNQEQAKTADRSRAQAAYDDTKTELSKLAPSRPASEVEARRDSQLATNRLHEAACVAGRTGSSKAAGRTRTTTGEGIVRPLADRHSKGGE